MLKVGLTGGYASGKSFICKYLEELGCHVIYADQLGHQVLAPGGEAFQPAISSFGNGILTPEGFIDRRKLAAIVFDSPELLARLNAIVHPAVFRLEERALLGFESQNPQGVAIIEAAILVETGRYKTLNRLIVVSCQPEIQIERAIRRDQITREEAQRRIARQLPDAERVRFADYVIDTNGSPEDTISQTHAVYAQLRALRP